MTVAWTTPERVADALGPSAAPPIDDAWLAECCAAANAAAYRKRGEAGYSDDPADDAPAPTPDVAMGATWWAVALWRGRQSTESFQSFEDIAGWAQVSGTWAEIKRLLGVGRAQTDRVTDDTVAALMTRRRRRRLVVW